MIVLQCPECSSKKIVSHDSNDDIWDWFKCEECDHEFTYDDAAWEAE